MSWTCRFRRKLFPEGVSSCLQVCGVSSRRLSCSTQSVCEAGNLISPEARRGGAIHPQPAINERAANHANQLYWFLLAFMFPHGSLPVMYNSLQEAHDHPAIPLHGIWSEKNKISTFGQINYLSFLPFKSSSFAPPHNCVYLHCVKKVCETNKLTNLADVIHFSSTYLYGGAFWLPDKTPWRLKHTVPAKKRGGGSIIFGSMPRKARKGRR